MELKVIEPTDQTIGQFPYEYNSVSALILDQKIDFKIMINRK